MRLYQSLALGAALAALFCVSSLAQGQELPLLQYNRLDRPSDSVGTIGSGLFGESVDLYSGQTEFSTTDISIPGNSALPVRLGRRLKAAETDHYYDFSSFANWENDVPHLSGYFAGAGWVVGGNASVNRCSVPVGQPTAAAPPVEVEVGYAGATWNVFPTDFWHGYQMYVPGAGTQEMLVDTSSSPHPTDPTYGNAYHWVTKGNWAFRCVPLQAPGTGEGFVAVSPDGTRYTFDRMVQLNGIGTYVNRLGGYKPSTNTPWYLTFPRHKVVILATRIDDRFGNWVTYSYNASNQLTQIAANDGRSIVLTWNTKGHVDTATDGVHTWRYQYAPVPVGSDNSISEALIGVVQPDGSSWGYSYGGDLVLHDESDPEVPHTYGCTTPLMSTIDAGAGYFDLTATHPSGATGVFHFLPRVRGRSYVVDAGCTESGYFNPKESLQFVLKTKTLSGPGVPTSVWNYSYSASNASFTTDCTTTPCPTSIWTDVTDPAGARVHRVFGNQFKATEGQLQETTVSDSASNVLDDDTTAYVANATGQAFPANVGVSPDTRSNTFLSQTLHPVLTHNQVRDGVTFTSQANAFNVYANPLSTTRSSSLGFTRTDVATFDDNTSLWVLEQPKTLTNSNTNTVVYSKTYGPVTALLQNVSSYGLFDQSYTFWPDGNIKTVTEGTATPAHVTTLSNYYRGVPRLLQFPDSTSKTAVVDGFGHITGLTDELGYAMGFAYDPMGRLATITQPTGDTVAWSPTTISFAQVNSSEYGLPTGHWKQTETTGNMTKITYLDGFWQPVLTRAYDAGSPSTTTRFTSKSFDFAGRTTFSSYPVASFGAYNSTVNGVHTSYDGIGRPTTSTQDSELTPGTLTTSYAYLPGFQTRITNPRGNSTTTSYQVFGSPDIGHPSLIVSPEGATTTITRDVFGKPLTLKRSGTWNGSPISETRSYVYDANQRLCKRVEPETGATMMDYDLANNIAWTLTGSALTSLACDRYNVLRADVTYRSYDARNRLQAVDVPYTANDIAYTYFNDGALRALSNGTGTTANTWTHAYNKRRLPVTEQLIIDGRTRTITHGYNALGHENSLTYPDGLVINTVPNALGQPGQAGAYATGVSYFPNGGMSGFTYHNGIVHSLTQNTRELPLRSLDQAPLAAAVLDDTYNYDENGNVTGIADGTTNNTNGRTMAYDGLDRLTGTTAPFQPWKTASTIYDPLDNIRTSNVGTRWNTYTYNPTTWRLGGITGGSTYTLGYDAIGNVTSKGTGFDSYVFDAANRMQSVAGKESYVYDGYGRRVKVTRLTDSKIDYPVYTMGGALLTEDDQRSGKTTDYISLNGSLVAKRAANIGTTGWVTTYEHTDALHSPITETSNTGVVNRIERYTPYGEPSDGSYTQGPGFTGHVTDAFTGLTYAQQRYYDPVIGRFLSADPVQASDNGASFNRYWYANNNPYKFTDADGRQAACDETCEFNDMRQQQAGPAKMVADGSNAGADGTSNFLVDQVNHPIDAAMMVAVPEEKLAVESVEIYRGTKLARAMDDAGRGVVKGVEDTHHIAAENAKIAQPARDVLARVGIDINHEANGAAMLRSAHQVEHTTLNYQRVNDRLAAAELNGARAAVLQELRTIGAEKTAIGQAIGNVVSSTSFTLTP